MGQFHSLPIIMVTGRDGLFDKVKGRMAGAIEYLTKPFDENQLKALIARHIPVGNTGR
jgi:twitching motility two-component system response regulator PilG